MQRRETPLPGWRNWVRWKGWRNLDSAHVLTSSQSRTERHLSWRLLGCQWLPHSTSQSELSKWSGPACFTPQCSTGSGAARKGGQTTPPSQRWPTLRRGPRWAVARQEPPRLPRAAPLLQLTYQYVPSPRRSLPDYKSGSTIGVGVRRQAAVIDGRKQRGFTPKAASEWSSRCPHRLCIRPVYVQAPHASAQPSGAMVLGTERGRNRCLKGKESAWAWPPGLLL